MAGLDSSAYEDTHEVADIAVLLASKLLERNLAKEDNARLIDETLKQIEISKQ